MRGWMLALFGSALLTGNFVRADDRPNIVMIVSDDQRADTIGALGNPHIRTPHLDRLVERGCTLNRAYCQGSNQGAVCVATRAMFMSGRSLFRVPMDLPPSVPLLPSELAKAGYATYGVGKWHNGQASYARAFEQGGPIFFGGMSNQSQVPLFDFQASGKYPKNLQRIGDGFSTELFCDAAIKCLDQPRDGKPFFLYVALTTPHDPRTPPAEYAKLYDPAKLPLPANFLPEHPFDNGELKVRDELLLSHPRDEAKVRAELANYYGLISHTDAQVGRVLDALDQRGLTNKTIVLFLGDHGLALGSHGLLGKQNLYEHSMLPPVIIAGPGIPKHVRRDALCYLFDLPATLYALSGTPVPPGVEGKSLVAVLQGQQTQFREALLLAYMKVQRAVVEERYKLIHYPHIDRTQLFDLQADPHERKDLSADPAHAERVQQLRAKLHQLQVDFADPLLKPAPKSAEKPAKS